MQHLENDGKHVLRARDKEIDRGVRHEDVDFRVARAHKTGVGSNFKFNLVFKLELKLTC